MTAIRIAVYVCNASGSLEHALSQLSEAYSDVFEEDLPEHEHMTDDAASEAASINDCITQSRIGQSV